MNNFLDCVSSFSFTTLELSTSFSQCVCSSHIPSPLPLEKNRAHLWHFVCSARIFNPNSQPFDCQKSLCDFVVGILVRWRQISVSFSRETVVITDLPFAPPQAWYALLTIASYVPYAPTQIQIKLRVCVEKCKVSSGECKLAESLS